MSDEAMESTEEDVTRVRLPNIKENVRDVIEDCAAYRRKAYDPKRFRTY